MASKTEYTCDSCGKVIKPYMNMIDGVYHGDIVGQDRPTHTLIFSPPGQGLKKKPDLCKKCLIKEITDYIKNY